MAKNKEITQDEIDDVIKFVNKLFPADNIRITILKNSDFIQVIHVDGTKDDVFAAYCIEDREILVPDYNGDRQFCFSSLMHEYIHAYDNDNGSKLSEEDVEEMATHLCEVYRILNYK